MLEQYSSLGSISSFETEIPVQPGQLKNLPFAAQIAAFFNRKVRLSSCYEAITADRELDSVIA